MSTHPLEQILHPQSIAITGASNNPTNNGYHYTRHLVSYGYRGKIYPVNPKYPDILEIKCYPSLKDIPGPVDYVISCVPAEAVLDMLEECSQKGVKAAHLFTARFSETGHKEAAALEQELLKRARRFGIRIIGPNCMGVYYPQEGMAFAYDFPKEPGVVGMAAQTGGGSAQFVNLASKRGIRFSKVISYGNAIDFNECDYLDYFSHDPETKVIMMYIEGVKDGKRFFDSLRKAASTKPVVILKGGRGESGTRAAASHTASLAGSMKVWDTLVAQAGAISAGNLNEMVDLATSFYFLPPIYGLRAGVYGGGGGGATVMGADECEEAGLNVINLPAEIREALRGKNNPIWDWVGNPIDGSIMGGFDISAMSVFEMMSRSDGFDLLIGGIAGSTLFGKERMITGINGNANGYLKIRKETSKPLLVAVQEDSLGTENYCDEGAKAVAEARTNLIAAGIPIYPTLARAARAARRMIDYYKNRR